MNEEIGILQVNALDDGGGAEKVAMNLHLAYLKHGFKACLGVGHRRTEVPSVLRIDNDAFRTPWARFWLGLSSRLSPVEGKLGLIRRVRRVMALQTGQPRRWLGMRAGHEDFDVPATWRLLDLPRPRPGILHCHNLHGSYFDLRALPFLSGSVPLVMTLHDAWLLSGHCAQSFDCERWEIGCGHCPDLTIYPAIRRDATSGNWHRKSEIYSRSRLYLATPSKWLMDRVMRSMLRPGVKESRIIPNGVDLSVFHPAGKNEVRNRLDLPQDAGIMLFTANSIKNNIWKDFATLQGALGIISETLKTRSLLFLALGENAPDKQIGNARMHFIPYQNDPGAVAAYYQASDLYVHAARADTFPNTVIEALACGTPVVATAVGGVPEQINPLPSGIAWDNGNPQGSDRPTGMLVPKGDARAMSEAIRALLGDEALRLRSAGECLSLLVWRDPCPEAGESLFRAFGGFMKVSVITVCKNSEGVIEKAIQSVLDQSYKDMEYLLIDGGSTDRTLEIAEKYKGRIDFMVSEKDGGIYDAMNKGVKHATGEIVYFLNSDDSLFDRDVVADVIGRFGIDAPLLVYGNIYLINDEHEGIVKYDRVDKRFFLHNTICHQALFMKRDLLREIGPYDDRYRVYADMDWLIKAFLKHGHAFRYYDRVSAHAFHDKKYVRERMSILSKYFLKKRIELALKRMLGLI
jgi:glycosyltransferase involved in cell wall biosynthesis